MRIILATSVTPWVQGGSTQIVTWLHRKLVEAGHSVDCFEFPIDESYPALLDQGLALRLIEFAPGGDRLITIRTPSHLLRHCNKVSWFIHHYRSAYDLWGTPYQAIPGTPEGVAYRDAIIQADNLGLNECRRVYCNSAVVRGRLSRFNQISAEVLYPPLIEPDRFHCNSFGNYLLYLSRLTHHKRQWLAIEALRYTTTPVRLVIAGAPDPDAGSYLLDLDRSIRKYRLDDRVSLLPRWLSEEDKIDLFANCRAAIYFPFDEDSYGYPTLEAHAAGKAVLTTLDAGGTAELVTNENNGFLIPSDPELIAACMDRIYREPLLAQQMGEAGRRRIEELGITWDNVLRGLLA